MAQHSFAGFAVFVALTFAFMALHGCASSEQRAGVTPLTPEFHGAPIGDDALRSRAPSET